MRANFPRHRPGTSGWSVYVAGETCGKPQNTAEMPSRYFNAERARRFMDYRHFNTVTPLLRGQIGSKVPNRLDAASRDAVPCQPRVFKLGSMQQSAQRRAGLWAKCLYDHRATVSWQASSACCGCLSFRRWCWLSRAKACTSTCPLEEPVHLFSEDDAALPHLRDYSPGVVEAGLAAAAAAG